MDRLAVVNVICPGRRVFVAHDERTADAVQAELCNPTLPKIAMTTAASPAAPLTPCSYTTSGDAIMLLEHVRGRAGR